MSLTDSPVLLAGSSLLLLAFVKIATTYINRRSLKNLQGPASPSFWIGQFAFLIGHFMISAEYSFVWTRASRE